LRKKDDSNANALNQDGSRLSARYAPTLYSSAGYNSARVLSTKLPPGEVGDVNIRDFEARMELVNASLGEININYPLTARQVPTPKKIRADSLSSFQEPN